MKDFFKNLPQILPQILKILPQIAGYIPMLLTSIVVLTVLSGVGFGVYYYVTTVYKDPFHCVDGEIYQQIQENSNVYVYKGGSCVETKNESIVDQIKNAVNDK
jgi:hypothetical protein